jgi:hypothetical protein
LDGGSRVALWYCAIGVEEEQDVGLIRGKKSELDSLKSSIFGEQSGDDELTRSYLDLIQSRQVSSSPFAKAC